MGIRVLSLGAGVQSTTVALMARDGEIPPFDAAVFADTGWEPREVYAHLDALEALLPYPILRVTAGNLRVDALDPARKFAAMPLFTPAGGMGQRQCTSQYKIRPIRRALQAFRAGAHVDLALGISLDEVGRMRDSGVAYLTNTYPLVEARFTRWDCQVWMAERGYPPAPRSACVGCPYRSDAEWRALPPDEWADAVEFDAEIRPRGFLHRRLIPLAEVDLSTPEDRGQGSLFGAECEGMCGV